MSILPADLKEWLKSLKWVRVSGEEFAKLNPDDKLLRIRHSSSHLMASALQQLYPSTIFATGPATGEGFFYDIRLGHDAQPLSTEDLPKIQDAMDAIAQKKLSFETTAISKEQALEYFKRTDQTLKLEIIAKIPSDTLTLYRHGDFVDLCAGPHVPHTGWCKNSKVLALSAVHWKKDEKIPSLTRVSGTAWTTPEELKQYLELLEEVKTRDHRVLGPQLDLFSFHPWAAAALWHPNGLILRNELMSLWRQSITRDPKNKYIEILNPLLYRKELYECSGHWAHFQENIFIFKDEQNEPSFILKPMNCPDTMLFFKSKSRSYRELPLRIAEGQILHRNETTGALHGIMRTRNFVQDDAHIFLTPDQVHSEMRLLLKMLDDTYKTFGLRYNIRLSTRPAEFMGSIEVWNKAEESLKNLLKELKVDFTIGEGEGAFYGPKVDIVIKDSLGRDWQCGTFQLDFQLPERFELNYKAEDGSLKRPIVVHRAIFGSIERFIGVLTEHFGGAFPTWLAPVQVAVLPIAERHADYANTVLDALTAAGVRSTLLSDESINYRIRHSETQKIPYMLVMGDREKENSTVTVRRYGQKEQRAIPLQELLAEIQGKITNRVLDVTVKDYGALFASKNHVTTENEVY